jgi:hypothetical protein
MLSNLLFPFQSRRARTALRKKAPIPSLHGDPASRASDCEDHEWMPIDSPIFCAGCGQRFTTWLREVR